MTDAICSVLGCGRTIRCREWCEAHYCRWLAHGDVRAEIPVKSRRSNDCGLMDAFSRFMSGTPPMVGCWLWGGYINSAGYGRMSYRKCSLTAHRVAYELFIGSIPDGLHICHHCDTPSCCNPAHLYAGTHADNMRDISERNRNQWHGMSGENNPAHKLDVDDVVAIRRQYAVGGISQSELARQYGVFQTTISKILRGRSWHHVPLA